MAKNNSAAKKTAAYFKNQDNGKKRLSTNSIVIIVTAAILLVTLLTTGIFFLVDAIRKDKMFNYLRSDITKYITVPEQAYKNYELELSIAKPHAIDVDVALLNLISSKEFRTLQGQGGAFRNKPITAGDKLNNVYYRGYTIENGEKKIISVSTASNIYSSAVSIQIGEDNTDLPIGFELDLIGKIPADYVEFKKITEGKVSSDYVIYISGTRAPANSEDGTSVKLGGTRIDLSETEDVEKYFGKGFTDIVLEYTIGQKYNVSGVLIGEGDKAKEYNYTDLKVEFATTCEKEETAGGNILTVEGYYAYDYGVDGIKTIEALRNHTVYYDVWIEDVTPYDTVINEIPVDTVEDITDEVVRYLISTPESELTEEELNTCEGTTLVQKYRKYAEKKLDEAYEEALKAMIENELWSRLLKAAEVKKYPGQKVEDIYEEYEGDLYYQFDNSGGMLADSEGNYTSYETVDEFALAYLQLLDEDADWREYLNSIAESLVKERLILFYIIQVEDMYPDKSTLKAQVDKIKQEYLDEFIVQYIAEMEEQDESFSVDEMSEEEYAEFVEERRKQLFDYYDDDYFEEQAHYELALEALLKNPTVYTLDNPKPAEDK